jgi:hypothetical protein
MWIPEPPPGPPEPDYTEVVTQVITRVGSLTLFMMLLSLFLAIVKLVLDRAKDQRYAAPPRPVQSKPTADLPPLPDWWRSNPELMEISRARGKLDK